MNYGWGDRGIKRSDKAKVRDTGVDKSKDKKSSVGDNLGDRKDTVGDKSEDQKMDFAGRLPVSSTPMSVKKGDAKKQKVPVPTDQDQDNQLFISNRELFFEYNEMLISVGVWSNRT